VADQDPAETGTSGTRAIKDRNQRIREEAAQKRRSRREAEQRRSNVQRNLGASEMVDDALARGTHAATAWLKRHVNVIQWVVLLGAAGGIGWQIYSAHRHKVEARATDTLMAGINAEFGRVGGDEEAEPDQATGLDDPRQHFPDEAARAKAAESAYRAATGSDNIRALAQLGLAGTLYDAGKYKDALAAYDVVRASGLAAKDLDVRMRAVEGAGFCHEALGEKDAAGKAFRELASSDVTEFAALGLYHQGRLALAAGDRDGAKELFKKALDKVSKDESPDKPLGYVSSLARELLGTIDPSAVPPLPQKNVLGPEQLKALQEGAGKPGAPGGLSKEKLEELMKQIQQHPPAPAPAPSGAPAGKP
jgi:predicted negative regulator of RcsB-dependent stress response